MNIVFVSSDFDDESWREHCAEMPWYALDYKDRDKEVDVALLPSHLILVKLVVVEYMLLVKRVPKCPQLCHIALGRTPNDCYM